jgi:hypothetical protein
VIQRVSPIEWSGSAPVMASGSASAVVASSKETLCFVRFAVALRSSHVTRIDRFYDLIGHCSASSANVHGQRPRREQRERAVRWTVRLGSAVVRTRCMDDNPVRKHYTCARSVF